MKNKKIITVLGSAILAASVFMCGCSVKVDDKDAKETAEETTEETEEEEDYCSSGCDEDEEYYCSGCSGDADDEYYYSSMQFQSTNGELEGQMDYMQLVTSSEFGAPIPDDYYITDLSVIEDEDLRALAQSYVDEGYQICDPEIDLEMGWNLGDGEYMFNNGFSAEFHNDNVSAYVYAYKMNETLFDYFFVDSYPWDDDAVTEDDGTTIRVSEDGFYVEFNRDTGIGIYYYDFEDDYSFGEVIEEDI